MSNPASAERRPFWLRFLRGLGEALLTIVVMVAELAIPFVFVGLGEEIGGEVGLALSSFGILLLLLMLLYHSVSYLLKKGEPSFTHIAWRLWRDSRPDARTSRAQVEDVDAPSRLSLREWIVIGMPAGRAPSAALDAAVGARAVEAINLTTAEAIVVNGLLDQEATISVPINPPEGQSTTDARAELYRRGVIHDVGERTEIAPAFVSLVGVGLLGPRATDVSVRSEDGAQRTTVFVRTESAAVMAEYSLDPGDLSGYRLTAIAPESVPQRVRKLLGIDARITATSGARQHAPAVITSARTIVLTDVAVGADGAAGAVRSVAASLRVSDDQIWLNDIGATGERSPSRQLSPQDAAAWVDAFVQ